MSEQNRTVFTKTLDDLLRSRFHGASNITGIRFQLLYSLLRAFDLYEDPSVIEVQFEGLEDVDLKGLKVGDVYLQVKSSRSKQGWGWINKERVLDHFVEAYRANPSVRFVVVTNFAFKGQLKELKRFCSGQVAELHRSVRRKMDAIAARSGLASSDIVRFLRSVSFEHIAEQAICAQLRATLIRYFELDTGNETLYLSRLFDCVAAWAAERATIERRHLEAERLRVQDWISLGTENPAVRDRLIQPLTFAEEETTEDYYEGKRARPGHILAGLDAPRPLWQQEIKDTLKRVKVCVMRTSSGQGKSTLLYRYAFDHFIPDTIYRLRACTAEEHAGQLVDYLRNRLALGLPLLVLVDNLSYSTRLWHRVAGELAGENVRFLVTAREEDWYRYGLGTSGFVWDFVKPCLSPEEARDIFRYFQQRDRIAAGVPSAVWAYEQVADKRLLIEFVYLITHGQMLADRIEEQIKTIKERGEDPAKLDVLRLVATAQVHGARVSIQSLLQGVHFHYDPQSTLKSLEREYLECHDGECEGLHFVRSDHLVEALHDPLPVEHTLARLLGLLDQANLVALISSVFADPSIRPDDLLAALLERCRGVPLSLINAVIEALFVASETTYFQAHKHLFDAAIEQAGPSSLMMLTSSTLPTGDLNILRDLAEMFTDRPAVRFLSDLVPQFRSRQETDAQRVPRAFLRSIVEAVRLDETVSPADIADLSTWCQFFNVSAPNMDEFFAGSHWEPALHQCDGESASSFLQALYNRLPHRHRDLVTSNKGQLFDQFKLRFDTLTVEEQNGDIGVEFIVDESDEAENSHEQALSRLRHLHGWFPQYDHYCSQGLYPSTGEQSPEVDDSHKNIAGEALDVSLHAPRNALYGRLVEEHYAPRLAVDWAQHWYNLRRTTLRLARTLISQYEGVHKGRQFNTRQSQSLAAELESLYQQAPKLPVRLAGQFHKQEKAITDWSSSMLNFLQQSFQHAPHDSQDRQSFLMRYNLKDAIKKLPALHQAFTDFLGVEPDHFDMAALDSQESATYLYLADIIDYWFEGQQQQRVPNLRATVRRWKEAQGRAFAVKVRESLAPLARVGMTFLYPTGPLDEHPLTGVSIGYEVLDFEKQAEQVGYIGVTIASLELAYDFLYLVPSVRRHQLSPLITRVGRDTLRRLAAGEEAQGGVYPMRPPEGLYTVLPDLDPTPLPDVALVHRLGEVQRSLVMERSRLYFARSRLDADVREQDTLLRRYEDDALARSEGLLEQFSHLQTKVLSYEDTGAAQQEWLILWNQAAVLIQSLADFSDVTAAYTPQPAVQQSALDRLFAKYMNRRYLKS